MKEEDWLKKENAYKELQEKLKELGEVIEESD